MAAAEITPGSVRQLLAAGRYQNQHELTAAVHALLLIAQELTALRDMLGAWADRHSGPDD